VVAATGTQVPAESTLERVLTIIHNVDEWLDSDVPANYKTQPLGQDWARVAKVAEEVGEAIDALIGCTGQNPRKGYYGEPDDLLAELADVAVTGMFAIQHFTKSADQTASVIMKALEKAAKRAAEAGYGD
jgi:NTP pyrophosphatase (non-canonical NTP hydrolase)